MREHKQTYSFWENWCLSRPQDLLSKRDQTQCHILTKLIKCQGKLAIEIAITRNSVKQRESQGVELGRVLEVVHYQPIVNILFMKVL